MLFKVKKYRSHPYDYHVCEDENGRERRIDLLVNGDLPKDTTPESLVGKTVKVHHLHAYVEIAHDVEIIEEIKMVSTGM